jgi:hypothetical protein
MYKHHAYTFSHYSNCARTDQLEQPMAGDDRIQVWFQDHNLAYNNYTLR